jgi:23S rRNA (uracil1939-C5)-methyltransferase
MKGIIESIAFGGEGILRHEGLVIFVPLTAPNDEVEVEILTQKKNFAHGTLTRLDKKSSSRTTPRCPHFGACGGCQLQHLNHSSQVDVKRMFILDALMRIGKIEVTRLTVKSTEKQWQYRRHIRLGLKKEGQGFSAGYRGDDPTQFVPVDQCPIFLAPENSLFASINLLLKSLSNEGIEEGTLRLIKIDREKFLLVFNFSARLPQNHLIVKTALEENQNWAGVIMHSPQEQKQWGETKCEVELLGLKVRFSPFGFVQNHPEQSENLYQAILDALPKNGRKILDLYCGIGLTSLLFARAGWETIGVESHSETIALAKQNAVENNLPSAQFYEGKSESLGVELLKKERPDIVLCNPPRTGLNPQLIQALLEEKPPCIFYVSCMPSTLARDLQKLIQGGYRIEGIQGFDMFPQTTHVETFVHLRIIPKTV